MRSLRAAAYRLVQRVRWRGAGSPKRARCADNAAVADRPTDDRPNRDADRAAGAWRRDATATARCQTATASTNSGRANAARCAESRTSVRPSCCSRCGLSSRACRVRAGRSAIDRSNTRCHSTGLGQTQATTTRSATSCAA